MSNQIERPHITKEEARNRAALSLNEFHDLTGISLPTLHRHIKSGELQHLKLGGRILIPSTVFSPMIEGGVL